MPGRSSLAEVENANRQLAALRAAAAAAAPVRTSSGASLQHYYEPLQVKYAKFFSRGFEYGMLAVFAHMCAVVTCFSFLTVCSI